MESLEVTLQFTAPYSLENPTERTNRTVKTMIAHYIEGHQSSWDELLPEITLAVNSSGNHAYLPPCPYKVVKFFSPNVVRLTKEGEPKRRVANIAQLKPFHQGDEGIDMIPETEIVETKDEEQTTLPNR
ncbi:hypothetical protein AWZ03_014683, partial [Drosophila navojoa]